MDYQIFLAMRFRYKGPFHHCSSHVMVQEVYSRVIVHEEETKGASTGRKLKEVVIGNFSMWLNPRAGNMKRFCSDWLPERARWANRTRSGFFDVKNKVPRDKILFSSIFRNSFTDQPCLIKILDIGIVCS